MSTSEKKDKRVLRIAFVAVQEKSSSAGTADCRCIKKMLEKSGFEIIEGGIVAAAKEIKPTVEKCCESKPDLFLLLTLSGRSAVFLARIARCVKLPCIIWAIGKGYALASSTLAIGVLRESEKRQIKLIYGAPQDSEAKREFLKAARVSYAVARLRQSKIGIIGGLFPNLVSCRYNPGVLRARMGVKLVEIPYAALRAAVRKVGNNNTALKALQYYLCDSYRMKVPRECLLPGLKLHMALKYLAREKTLVGFAIECWTGILPEAGLNPCLGFVEDDYVMACEGDVLLGVGLLMVKYITGSIPYAGDIYSLDKKDVLTLRHCGGPASLSRNKKTVVLSNKSPLSAQYGGATVTCRPRLTKGNATLIRFYGRHADRMHVAFGKITGEDTSHDLTVYVKLAGNRSDFLEHCTGNHYLVVSGDIREELKLFCRWLQITMVET